MPTRRRPSLIGRFSGQEEIVESVNKGLWRRQYRANKYHDCSFCDKEICPSEFYDREAILIRPKGMNKRGTVEVFKKCQAH